jgi:N-acetylneuraminic acid mutarotase
MERRDELKNHIGSVKVGARSKMRRSFGLSLILAFVIALLAFPTNTVAAASVGQWTSTTSYPLQVAGDSCALYSDNVYCIGGFDAKGKDYANTYYASLSDSGIGAWTSTTPYPALVDSSACVVSSAVMYCVGGENSTSVLSNVYDAPLSQTGIGAWSQAAAYPQTIAAPSCVVYSGYVYCIGGFDITGDETAAAYYSSLSSGLTSWTSTTSYPFAVNSEACMVQANYVYCVAGNEESGLPQFPVANVYYAELSASGIGPWTETTQYPNALASVSCVLNSGTIYCAGGFNLNQISSNHVYFSTITASGVSSWTNSTAYPVPFDVSSCVTDFSYMYCIAGRTFEGKAVTMSNADYFALLGGAGTSTTSTSSTTASSTTVSSSTSRTTTSTSTASTGTFSASTSTTSTSTSISSTTTTSAVPEFNGGALLITTLVALSVAALLFRARVQVDRRGIRSESSLRV